MIWLGIVLTTFLVVRWATIAGTLLVPDFLNLVVLCGLQYTLARKPQWARPIAWLTMVAFIANAADPLIPFPDELLHPTFILLPLLVLFGACVGDPFLSLFALTYVLGTYLYAWSKNHPLTTDEAVLFTNLYLVACMTGLAAFGVWITHNRMSKALRKRAMEMRHELETNLRLTAVMYHDISNPLQALAGFQELALMEGSANSEELRRMNDLSARITNIISSVRKFASKGTARLELRNVHMEEILAELDTVLGLRLAQKQQKLELDSLMDYVLYTDPNILINSILTNLVTNAHKFSPRGAAIVLRVRQTHSSLRIEVRNSGGGFDPTMLERMGTGALLPSTTGTEGEGGTGFGMRIITLYLRRLQGHLEVCNLQDGGAAVAVVLPRTVLIDSEPE